MNDEPALVGRQVINDETVHHLFQSNNIKMYE
jgi:hypothetical protein